MSQLVNDIKDAINNATDAAIKNHKDYSVVYLPELETAIHMEATTDLKAYDYDVITTIRVT